MKEHNYQGTINFFSNEPHIFLPTAFKTIDKEFYQKFINHNIYLIAKTNRIWFHPAGIKLDKRKNNSYCQFVIQDKYDRIVHPIISKVPKETDTIEVSKFPHREMYLKNKHGDIIGSINALEFLMTLPENTKPDFEILYVGKSYGRKKKINIIDRLFKQQHKKFREILIDTIEDSPDKQVVILALNFAFEKKIISNEFKNLAKTTTNEKSHRIKYLKEIDINRTYKIDLIEEALINYFAPKYNDTLKESLSKLSSKAIKAFQKLGLSSVVVEFNTKSTGIKLKSNYVSPKKLHVIQFSTSQNELKTNFFDLKNIKESRQLNNDKLLDLI